MTQLLRQLRTHRWPVHQPPPASLLCSNPGYGPTPTLAGQCMPVSGLCTPLAGKTPNREPGARILKAPCFDLPAAAVAHAVRLPALSIEHPSSAALQCYVDGCATFSSGCTCSVCKLGYTSNGSGGCTKASRPAMWMSGGH